MGLLCCLTIRGFGQVSDAQNQMETLLREAHRRLGENNPDAAIPEFRAIIALDPSNIDALGNLGVVLFFHSQYGEVRPSANRIFGRSRRCSEWPSGGPATRLLLLSPRFDRQEPANG